MNFGKPTVLWFVLCDTSESCYVAFVAMRARKFGAVRTGICRSWAEGWLEVGCERRGDTSALALTLGTLIPQTPTPSAPCACVGRSPFPFQTVDARSCVPSSLRGGSVSSGAWGGGRANDQLRSSFFNKMKPQPQKTISSFDKN